MSDWAKGNRFSAAHLQQPIDAIRAIAFADASNAFVPTPQWREMWPGIIVSAGPNGESLTSIGASGEQYWVQKQFIPGAMPNDVLDFDEDKTEQAAVSSAPNIFLVTNLPEWKDSTHGVPDGEIVLVFGWWDEGPPPGQGDGSQSVTQNNLHYIMVSGGGALPPGGFKYQAICRIDDGPGPSLAGGTADWIYICAHSAS